MTPMIDVTFLLLTFFMLASHFASVEKVPVDLPDPDDNQAIDKRFPDKVIVNVLYVDAESEPALQLGPMLLASHSELAHRLGNISRGNPDVQVIFRADRRLTYGQVRPIMNVIASAGLRHLQVATDLESAQ